MPFKINELWAFVSTDEEGVEGVCAFRSVDGWLPMVAADVKRLSSLRPLANEVAKRTGRPVQLIKFTAREDIEMLTGLIPEASRN